MNWRHVSSIKGRLIRLILLACTLAFLSVTAGVVLYESTSFQPRALAQLRQPANILKELLQPALGSDTREDVSRYLKKYCENNTNPLVAAVYDAEGNLFASYPANFADVPNLPAPIGHEFAAGTLVLWEQLEWQNQTLGHLYLREQLPPFYMRISQYSLMLGTLIITLVLISITLLVGVRRYVLKPLASLVKTSEYIAEFNDYKVRSELQQDDELGHLARTFNHMLEVISASDASLRQSEANLANDLKERKLAQTQLNNILQTSIDGFWRADWQG